MRVRFRPRLWPTLATILLLPTFIALGIWQLHRAQEKAELQADYDRRSNGPELALDEHPRAVEDLRFHRVLASGYYEPEYQILLDNRVHEGTAGYYVVTPLRLRDSDLRVLVNRGWVPLGRDREHLPAVSPPSGLQQVSGIATVPIERRFTLGDVAESNGSKWASVWQYLDLAQYAARVPFAIHPIVVLLDPASNAGGYVRDWGRLDAGIATHKGYAFQWFALALALITLYLFVNVKPQGRNGSKR